MTCELTMLIMVKWTRTRTVNQKVYILVPTWVGAHLDGLNTINRSLNTHGGRGWCWMHLRDKFTLGNVVLIISTELSISHCANISHSNVRLRFYVEICTISTRPPRQDRCEWYMSSIKALPLAFFYNHNWVTPPLNLLERHWTLEWGLVLNYRLTRALAIKARRNGAARLVWVISSIKWCPLHWFDMDLVW